MPNVESVQTSLFTRSADVAIDLATPPGHNGLLPKLQLTYSSNAINRLEGRIPFDYLWAQASWVGMGWSLDLGSVTDRQNGTFGIAFAGVADRIVQKAGGGDRYYLQHENFVKITRVNDGQGHDYWLALDKDGTEYRFGYEPGAPVNTEGGTNTGSRQDGKKFINGSYESYPRRWQLDRIRDTDGNVVTIRYEGLRVLAEEEGQRGWYDASVYPTEIRWNDRGQAPRWKIVFNRDGTRSDVPTVEFWESARLDNIRMYVNQSDPYVDTPANWELIRRYQLGQHWQQFYADDQNGSRWHLLLDSIQEFGSDDATARPAWTFSYENHYLRELTFGQAGRHDMAFLKEATNGYGGEVSFDYAEAARYDVTSDPEQQGNEFVRWWAVIARYVFDGRTDPSGAALFQRNTYEGTNAHFRFEENPLRPDFRGFNVVTLTDGNNPSLKQERRFFQGKDDGESGSTTRQRSDGSSVTDGEALIGREYEARWLDGANVLRRVLSDYQTAQWDAAPVGPFDGGADPDDHIYFAAQSDVREYQEDGSRRIRTVYETSYGNWLDSYEYAAAGSADWSRHVKQVFASSPNEPGWIVGRPRRKDVYAWNGSGEGLLKASTHFYYYRPAGPSEAANDQPVSTPKLIAVRRWRDEDGVSKFADIFYTYDIFGNKVKEEVARDWGADAAWGGNYMVTQWVDEDGYLGYDKKYRTFPKHVDNALAQRTTHVYYPKWGKPLSITDPNLKAATYAYDVFGRQRAEAKPLDTVDFNAGSGRYDKATSERVYYDASPFQIEIRSRKTDSGGPSGEYHVGRIFLDGLGREIQRYSDAASGQVCLNTYYDNRGLKRRESVPHLVTGTGQFVETDWKNWYNFSTTYRGSDHSYDGLRRALQISNPDGDSPSGRSWRKMGYRGWAVATRDENQHQRRHVTDAFGRLALVGEYAGTFYEPNVDAAPNATTAYEYDVLDNLTRVTDALGNVTTIDFDGLSRKKSMADPDMGSWTYQYDAAGSLTRQTDGKGQAIDFGYDALGRLTRKYYAMDWVANQLTTAHRPGVYDFMELRAAVDVDRLVAGRTPIPVAWSNEALVAGKDVAIRAVHFTELRDAIGELWSAAGLGSVPQFANGAIVAGTRAIKLGDPLDLRGWLAGYATNYEGSAWAQNGKRARAAYRYDSYSDGVGRGFSIGRRTELWDASGRARWTYDERGRTTKEERWIDGSLYTTQWTYDAMDRVTSMTYPDGEIVDYSYDAQLLLAGMTVRGGAAIASDIAYNALGLPTQVKLPNARSDLYLRYRYTVLDSEYSPYAALWDIRLERAGGDLLRLQHAYDPVRNLTRAIESPAGQDFSYEYDYLDRLMKRKITGGADQETFQYNWIGNITQKNGGATWVYGSKPHAVTNDGTQTYEYDGNGNMTRRGAGQYLKYDAENRLVKVSSDAGGTVYIARFAYDGDGKRVKRLDNNGTIHYVGPHYERNVGTGIDTTEKITKFYYAANRLIASRKNGTLYYVCTDHLGSTREVVDAQGNEAGYVRYHAYGADRESGGSLHTDKKFTSQTADASTGLYYYGARPYESALGRFVQPDTITPDAENPQALNRYAYAYGNPLNLLDPTGHDPIGPDWERRWRTENPDRDGPTDDDRMRELRARLDALAAEDDAFVSGAERFARYVQRLSSLYESGENRQFVRAFGFLFAGIHYSGSPDLNLLLAAFGNVRSDRVDLQYDLSPEGLRPEYLDSKPRDNQTHHYAAFLVQGYFGGTTLATITNFLRDGPVEFALRREWNSGDIALGNRAAVHGRALLGVYRGRTQTVIPPVDHSQLSGLIRRELIDGR